MPIVRLDSKDYVVQGQVRRYSLEPYAPSFRPSGLQRLEGLAGPPTSYIFPVPVNGFGLKRMTKVDDPEQARYFWDSRLETRWESAMTLPILDENSTEEAEAKVIRVSHSFQGNLWSLWQGSSGVNLAVVSRRYAGSTTEWTGGGTVVAPGTAYQPQALDLISIGDRMIALVVGKPGAVTSENDYHIRHSTDGVTWTPATTDLPENTAPFLSGTAFDQALDAGRLGVVGNEAIAVVVESNVVKAYSSTDKGTTWASEGTLFPATKITGVAAYVGVDGKEKLYVGTAEGLWEVDTSVPTWVAQPVPLGLPRHKDNCRGMTVHQGALWVPVGVDDSSPAPIYTITVRGDTRIITTDMGLDRGDGVPSDMLGPVRWMKSAGQFLFIAVGGGAAGRNARILCHNGRGWHHMYRHSTENQQIQWIDVASEDDSTPRLHFAVRTANNATDTRFLAQPLVNPQAGVAIKRQLSGYVDRPEFDGGMPRVNATWLQLYYDAIDLSPIGVSGEYINLSYGLDGASPTTDLGNVFSNDKDLDFGTASRGVASKSIQIRETYNRDAPDNTQSPKGRSVELVYMKRPKRLQAFEMQVDLVATALHRNTGVEGVIDELKNALDASTLVPFAYGKMGQVNVRVRAVEGLEQWEEPANPLDEGERRGTVKVVLEEVL